jgi:hypothetical protein
MLLGALMTSAMSPSTRRKAEYNSYKDVSRRGYDRDPDCCKNLRNRIDYLKRLNLMRHAWDMRWMTPQYPEVRHYQQIQKDAADIVRLEGKLREECPDDCN